MSKPEVKTIEYTLPDDDAAALKAHCRREGVTVSFFLRRLLRENVPTLRERYRRETRLPGNL